MEKQAKISEKNTRLVLESTGATLQEICDEKIELTMAADNLDTDDSQDSTL